MMNAADIARAIEVLNTAAHILRIGGTTDQQIAAGMECYNVAARLESALQKINVDIEAEQCDARRYRWLRAGNAQPKDSYAWFVENRETAANAPDNIDASIDAAMDAST